MSSIPQITDDVINASDFTSKFMKRFHIGRLLFKCNASLQIKSQVEICEL